MTELVKQKSGSDCVLAAIAMAAGKQHEDLWTDEDVQKCITDKGIGDEEPYMLRAGFRRSVDYKRISPWNTRQEELKSLLWGRRALLSVNSLNIDAGSHMVYWDGSTLFDPSTKSTFQFIHSAVVTSVILFNEAASRVNT